MGNVATTFFGQDKKQQASDYLDEKLAELLQKRATKNQVKASSFNKLLLRFGHLNKGFAKCKTVFHSLDNDGNEVIDLQELAEGCHKLGFDLSAEVIDKVYKATDKDGNNSIDFREFIVVLAVLYMISTEKEVTAVLLEGDKGGQQLEGVAMKGVIARRFEELDWDNNGQISFKEFLYAVQGWVLDEDESDPSPNEGEQEEAWAAKSAAAGRLRATDISNIKADASDRQFVTKSSMKKQQAIKPNVI